MKIKKQITTEISMEIKFSEITLLSIEEYESNKDLIPAFDYWWWLRSPGSFQNGAADVTVRGALDSSNVSYTCGVVRPALRIWNLESSNLESGDKLIIAGKTWTVLRGGLVLCDESIGYSAFCEDVSASDANVYEKSDVKKFVEGWAKENGIETEGN